MTDLPIHVPVCGYRVIENCLALSNGRKIKEVVDSAGGRTPIFVYDSGLIRERVAMLRDVLPERLKLHYAVKANPMPKVLELLAQLVDGFDVASQGELQRVLRFPINPTDVSFAGPGKRDCELGNAIEAGIVINVESRNELERVASIGAELGRKPNVALRVNPDFELRSSGMRMGGGAKPFGIDSEIIPDLLHRVRDLELRFVGFHIFCGSQSLRADALKEAHTRTFELATRLARHAPELSSVNIGGGFGIPYFPGDRPLELLPVAANLRDLMKDFHAEYPKAQVIMELGRFIVGEAGLYVCQVVDKKVSRGRTYLVTDGGLNHHLAASGNFGQVLRKNYPIAIGNRVFGECRETVSVVGPLCTPLDVLGDNVLLPEASVGDLIVVFQSGAYACSASPHSFLSHPPPAEVLV